TGIDPMTLIEKYGADATRFGLIWQAMGGQDIHWAEEHVMAGKKFCNKIWNISRFVLENTKDIDICAEYTKENKIVRSRFEKITTKNVNKNIENYEFGQALHEIYDFIWHEFADMIIEHSKTVFKDGTDKERASQKKLILLILKDSIKLLHPFMPFITEEIWQNLPLQHSSGQAENKKALIIEQW
ncbi:MAG: class I tRNA ligase family protein, partial [Spirochaetota bacterium]